MRLHINKILSILNLNSHKFIFCYQKKSHSNANGMYFFINHTISFVLRIRDFGCATALKNKLRVTKFQIN